jgi:hypothetical protein
MLQAITKSIKRIKRSIMRSKEVHKKKHKEEYNKEEYQKEQYLQSPAHW